MPVFPAACVSRYLAYKFLFPNLLAFDHGLEWSAPATHFALMRAFGVVDVEPRIKISLKLFDRFVQSLAERDLIKLLQYRFVEPLAASRRRFACLPANECRSSAVT